MKSLAALLFLATALFADGSGVLESRFLPKDFAINADPNSALWRPVKGIAADNDKFGKPVPGHHTEIRTAWSNNSLYFLFVCHYGQLYLKPDPSATEETNKLWDWDVAEVFIGADFDKIWQYREFQVSPQAEWVDLDIDRKQPKPDGGWQWNSGFTVAASIDRDNKVWYGAMRIPFRSLASKPVAAGDKFRLNCFRLQGPGPGRSGIAWQPTGKATHHVPEAFGTLVLRK